MQGRIVLPGEVGSQFEPSFTLEGLREMIRDLRTNGQRIPNIILVSEHERRDLNQELLGASVDQVDKKDQRPEHDGEAIGFVEGVMVRSHPDVPRGKARFIYPPVLEPTDKIPAGKIISLGVQAEQPKTIVVASA